MNNLALAVGAFYIFAGVVALRAQRFDRALDTMLEALEAKPTPAVERWKSAILLAGSALTLASGAALATLSTLAPPLFLAGAAVQAAYLLWAARTLPPTDADEAKGRRQTQIAFVVYLAATAFVVWLWQRGGLRLWPQDVSAFSLEVLIVGGITLAGWALMFVPRWLTRKDEALPEAFATPTPATPPVNLRLSPGHQRWPLWDADTGENVSHYHMGLPEELAERIEAWDDTWQENSNGFQTESDRRAYQEEGKLIAAELTSLWQGRIEVAEEFR